MGRVIIMKESYFLREFTKSFSKVLDLWEKGKISDKEFSKKMHKIESLFGFLQMSIMKIGVEEDECYFDASSVKSFIKQIWEWTSPSFVDIPKSLT